MILVWGTPGDPPLDAVCAALLRRDAAIALIDSRRLANLTVEVAAGGLSGMLEIGERSIGLEGVSGFYARPQTAPVAALDDALMSVAELTPAVVLNRPDAMAANGSKPYQYAQIRSIGFAVPETLITTSPNAAKEFLARHGRVVYKSVSSVRSIVSELGEADEERLSNIRWCPTQLQARVPGIDVRVHVVGERIFACEVRSEATDYRYAALSGQTVEFTPRELPEECAERCLALARSTELPLAGIDLRRAPSGDWFCFEVNPTPGFTYYEAATGQPIAEAVADLLQG